MEILTVPTVNADVEGETSETPNKCEVPKVYTDVDVKASHLRENSEIPNKSDKKREVSETNLKNSKTNSPVNLKSPKTNNLETSFKEENSDKCKQDYEISKLKKLAASQYKKQGLLSWNELIEKYADIPLIPLELSKSFGIFQKILTKMHNELREPLRKFRLNPEMAYSPHKQFPAFDVVNARLIILKELGPITKELEDLVSSPNIVWSKTLKDLRLKFLEKKNLNNVKN